MLILHATPGESIKIEGGTVVMTVLAITKSRIELGFEGDARVLRTKAEQKRRASELAKEANHD